MAGVKAGNVDAGQSSGTSGGGHQSIQVNNLMGYLSDSTKEKLRALDVVFSANTAVNEVQTNEPMIPRVPKELRDKNVLKDFFKPRVVSIGPYHHQNRDLKVTEEMKTKLAAIFICEHGMNKEDLYCRIRMKTEYLRGCYEVDATRDYSEDDLAWMFLLDGCVVLHFIYAMKYKYNIFQRKYKGLETLLAVIDTEAFKSDVMLLENQLPYRLLDLIIEYSTESKRRNLSISIQDFILLMAWNDQAEDKLVPEENSILALHLLDLLRTTVTHVPTQKKSSGIEWIIERLFKIVGKHFDSPMYFSIRNFVDISPRLRGPLILPNIRSVKDLEEAGVELKLNTRSSLTDVKFRRGTLYLPVIVVNDALAVKFLNLMAYEICKHNFIDESEVNLFDESGFCSYVLFLASIIDGPEDVKELRAKGILHNHLTSDERVVHLFKDIRIDGLGINFVYKYYQILDEIKKHYKKRKFYVWKAQLKRTYFRSPWSMIAMVGAIMILVLTFLQTFYTIFSYYKEK